MTTTITRRQEENTRDDREARRTAGHAAGHAGRVQVHARAAAVSLALGGLGGGARGEQRVGLGCLLFDQHAASLACEGYNKIEREI